MSYSSYNKPDAIITEERISHQFELLVKSGLPNNIISTMDILRLIVKRWGKY
jgi:hypothetical protein